MSSTADTAARAERRANRTRRVSAIFRELAARPEERISIYEIDKAFGDRSFSAIMLIFGLLSMAAVIPGSSFFTGAPLFVVAIQMVSGRKSLWLPEKIGSRTVRPADIARMNERFLPLLRRVERLLVPRFAFMFSPIVLRLLGIVCLVLATIIVLPIPLGNLAPGFAIALISLALLTRDGLAAIAGIILGIGSIVFLVSVYGFAIAKFLEWILPGNQFGPGAFDPGGPFDPGSIPPDAAPPPPVPPPAGLQPPGPPPGL